jgi:hypothetical protein
MIVEVRNYRTKSGRRAEFVRVFEERAGASRANKLLRQAVDFPEVDRFGFSRGDTGPVAVCTLLSPDLKPSPRMLTAQ